MKKSILVYALLGYCMYMLISFASCHNKPEIKSGLDSNSNALPPSSTNSDATNPSFADTAYKLKDTTHHREDSSSKHK